MQPTARLLRREQLGGYFLIDFKELDEAIALVERIVMARWGTAGIRPVIEMVGLPTKQHP